MRNWQEPISDIGPSHGKPATLLHGRGTRWPERAPAQNGFGAGFHPTDRRWIFLYALDNRDPDSAREPSGIGPPLTGGTDPSFAVAPGEARAATFAGNPSTSRAAPSGFQQRKRMRLTATAQDFFTPRVGWAAQKRAPVVSFTQDPAIRSWPRALLPAPLISMLVLQLLCSAPGCPPVQLPCTSPVGRRAKPFQKAVGQKRSREGLCRKAFVILPPEGHSYSLSFCFWACAVSCSRARSVQHGKSLYVRIELAEKAWPRTRSEPCTLARRVLICSA